ncbi:MAG: cysteine rich repeat-containing protein, partial [Rhodomicrobium sp.]
MNKAILFAAALSMTPLPAMSQQAQQSQDQSQDRQSTYSERDRDSRRGDLLDRLSRSDLRDRLSTAIQRLEGACGEDIEQFCSDVTPGGGRMASCMDAYSDQLSRSCSFALSRAADRIQQAVERFA